MAGHDLINADGIQGKIHTIKGLQVMLDSDLAELYGVEVKRLNEQVKRNIERFPEKYCFQLSEKEFNDSNFGGKSNGTVALRSQIATLNNRRGHHRKYLPYAFTEQGVAMERKKMQFHACSELILIQCANILNQFKKAEKNDR